MAWCYIKIGEHQKAVVYYQNLTDNYPDNSYTAEALFKLAEYYYNQSDYKTSIEYYEKITALPNAGDFASSSLYWMAWSYLNLNDKINSLKMFERYVDNYPKGDYSSDCLWRIAVIYNDLSNFEKAKQNFNKLLSMYPNSPDAEKAKIKLSEIDLKEKSGGSEEKLYQILVQQSQTTQAKVAAMYKLAMAYQRNGKTEEAVKLFNDIVNMTTGDEAALSVYELAEYDRQNGDYIEAIKLYGNIFYVYKYAEIYPQSLYGISYCYYKTDNIDTAKKYLERVIDKYKESEWSKKAKDLLNEIDKK